MSRSKPTPVRDFLAAAQFLTRLPIPLRFADAEDAKDSLSRSVVFFPLVGTLIALSTCVSFKLLTMLFPLLVASMIAVMLEAIMTGGFHEDALADSVDALGGGWTRDQVLAILKDSRHGTYGVLALIFGVGLRVSLIAAIPLELVWVALPLSGCLGRWGILWMMYLIKPIEDRHTLVKDVGGQPSKGPIAWSALFAIPVLACASLLGRVLDPPQPEDQPILFLCFERAGLALVFMLIVCVWYFRMIRQRVGGTTGDFLGAGCYLVQLATLLAFAVGTSGTI